MFDDATALAIFSAILLAGLLKGIIGVGFQTVGIAFLTMPIVFCLSLSIYEFPMSNPPCSTMFSFD